MSSTGAHYQPLEAEVDLVGPMVDGGHPVHLDSLLELAWIRRHRPHLEGQVDRFCPAPELVGHLPLARVEVDGQGLWVASAAIYSDPQSPALAHIMKRRDSEDVNRLARKFKPSAGPGKDYMLRRPAIVTRSARWLAYGDRREVVRALRLLWGREETPHGQLGSVRRGGWGRIRAWRVTAARHRLEDCLVRAERVVRHVPLSWLTAVEMPGDGAVEPPYWHPRRQQPVAVLGTGAQLHQRVLDALEVQCS